ncbi:Asp-tRNA(Asn)/Glu-tRNA(Gln) amidotransferase subunit GatC [Thermomicrobiaceae bacterium CFH 74404]|uniref:Aspartyl/glutamyl-tRNA(Asn/Gln) amidotransferase subunit C n=1 Tax=Thermalbibacter longus TaxID=2951981 RepID=A0AA41WG16_9BACT|nr:Asp-tRNA(Asn)/Glu-tRNA(Gln) amidotransferase subunit GatC [Thermalbibacter longus]MCM8748746.1 Asp-tRNA(Asn)/Glu-tRNA(Gln) amidotransferase subunit GatC [Thermalbibacter longus]
MRLSREVVDHVAMLARLGLTEEERERMREQLSSILEHVNLIQELDTEAIPPTAQVITLQNVWREDEVRPSLPVEDALKNAPDAEDNMFKVNAVLEQS